MKDICFFNFEAISWGESATIRRATVAWASGLIYFPRTWQLENVWEKLGKKDDGLTDADIQAVTKQMQPSRVQIN